MRVAPSGRKSQGPSATVNQTEIAMSERAPFLGSSSFASPSSRNNSRSSSPTGTPRSSEDDIEVYSEKHLHGYKDTTNLSTERLQIPHTPVLRRSRLRLILLCALALGGIISIGAWQAPDNVRTKAAAVAQHVGAAASDRWQSAKEWSGWNSHSHGSSSTSSSSSHIDSENEPHPLYVLPDPPWRPQGGPDEQFLSYMPHSGYHNQRVELTNALSLAKMLNRTLLLPPVWIGWPVTTQEYKRLQETWETVMAEHAESFTPHNKTHLYKRQTTEIAGPTQITADECKSYAKECRGTYQDTFVSWRFLTNIEQAKQRVPVVDRFNMTAAYARELAGVQSDDQVYLLEDLDKYYFHFHDTDNPRRELAQLIVDKKPALAQKLKDSKYAYTVSIPRLRKESADKKLLLLGSLFGSGRLWLEDESNIDDNAFFQRSLAFKNDVLDEPANQIRDLMGGPDGYAGVHARVGDGRFKVFAIDSMEVTFTKLMKKMGVDASIIPVLARQGREKAEALAAVQEQAAELQEAEKAAYMSNSAMSSLTQHKRFIHRRRATSPNPRPSSFEDDHEDMEEEDVLTQATLKRQISMPLPPVARREDMSLSPQMVCRGTLHEDSALMVLNNPVYIATDSRAPYDEPALQYFWEVLPCAFLLSDFDRPSPQNLGEPVYSLKKMQSIVNENDGVQLGRLFLPFMEAMVAAKGVVTAGTDGSTFSGFAQGVLHDAYREGAL